MYHTNFIKATYHDLKFFLKKEKDRVYEILDLHEIDLIESTKIVMLQPCRVSPNQHIKDLASPLS